MVSATIFVGPDSIAPLPCSAAVSSILGSALVSTRLALATADSRLGWLLAARRAVVTESVGIVVWGFSSRGVRRPIRDDCWLVSD